MYLHRSPFFRIFKDVSNLERKKILYNISTASLTSYVRIFLVSDQRSTLFRPILKPFKILFVGKTAVLYSYAFPSQYFQIFLKIHEFEGLSIAIEGQLEGKESLKAFASLSLMRFSTF